MRVGLGPGNPFASLLDKLGCVPRALLEPALGKRCFFGFDPIGHSWHFYVGLA